MTEKQPDPLRVADELDCHNARLDRQAAKVIRTQHAALERKDALLRRALDAILWGERDLYKAIASELAK